MTYWIVHIFAVLTKPRKWKMPTFQEEVKTDYCLFQKRDANQITRNLVHQLSKIFSRGFYFGIWLVKKSGIFADTKAKAALR